MIKEYNVYEYVGGYGAGIKFLNPEDSNNARLSESKDWKFLGVFFVSEELVEMLYGEVFYAE